MPPWTHYRDRRNMNFLILSFLIIPSSAVHVYETFQNPLGGREGPFEKMVVDRRNTGRVYIGGVNRLYELMPTLKERTKVITGPEQDSPNCSSRGGTCEESRKLTDSYTKSLAIYSKRSKLVECTSLFQGRCRLRNLYDITSPKSAKESNPFVANDRSSSTVVFVAPGPPNPMDNEVLYVGSTHADNGPFRNQVPDVVSLSLDDSRLFQVAHKAVNSETLMEMERSYRKSYMIRYVTGFSAGNFSYFVTTQPKLATGISRHHSKLIRLCHGDKYYHSYTEVPLQCTKGNNDYNLVQDAYVAKAGYDLARNLGIGADDLVMFAVFTKGQGAQEQKTPSRHSALCVYSMKSIEAKFLENIRMCNKGTVLKGLEWFNKGTTCQKTQFPEGHDVTCGIEVNQPIGGSMPVKETAIITTSQAEYTAIVAKDVPASYTVVFIGTRDGRLIKGVVETATKGFEYQTIEVDPGHPVLPDMDLDISGEFLFVLTPERVIKVKTHECQLKDRCSECLEARDPYCGWCSLENKCSVHSECNDKPTSHWLPYKDSRCTKISKVVPDKIQITSAAYLELTIENLPSIVGQLSCVFMVQKRTFVTGASRNDDKVSCPTPQTSLLPRIGAGQHSIVATLAVQVDKGPDFASTNFTFFDCSTYDSCTRCTQSDFPCDWCTQSHICTTNAEDYCRQQRIINGIQRRGPSGHKGPSFCPHIVTTNPDIYVPSGSAKEIKVQAKNILDFQENFECQFKIDHSVHRRKGHRQGNSIRCESMNFIYYGQGLGNGTDIAHFSISWAEGKKLDNSQGIQIVMYKCERLAPNCGLCLTLDVSKFKCGWCHSSNGCSRKEQCTTPSVTGTAQRGEWLDRSEICPNPTILDFYPKKGPIEGGTRLTITGINLGRSVSDIKDKVKVNNQICDPIASEYVVATKIVCVTKPSQLGKKASNPIIIVLKKGERDFITTSLDNFYYEDPVIIGIDPERGPRSGGTDVRIKGQNLDAGSDVSARIGGIDCEIRNRTNDIMVCRTGSSSSNKLGAIVVRFDRAEKTFLHKQFNYDSDPVIGSVRPEKSLMSGGIKINVRGDRLDLIQRPRMLIYGDKKLKGQRCNILNTHEMYCLTPPFVQQSKLNQMRAGGSFEVDFGFQLDGVEEFRKLTSKSYDSKFKKMIIYPNPVIYEFEEGVKYYRRDDYLTIKGDGVNMAATEDDVRVRIGKEWCNLTAIAPTALTCRPPTERPDPKDPQKFINPEVVVEVGYFKKVVGVLNYDSEGPTGPLSMQVIIAIAAAVGIFVIAIIALLIAYRRKSTRHTRQMKNLQMQMNAIEMKVASECKEAFAELQTSMSEMAQEMTVGIPFLQYKDYVNQVLFPNTVSHPVLRELEVDPHRAPQIEKGLRMFNQMLMNKTFLLLFVRTMEANKYFLSKDRVYVGSLLMVILQEKMEYCTEILKVLLAELIEKTVERRYQPKILFRRSESVAERMLAAWFTFLMHRYLVECAGRPLFMLYWAMKQQIEKGPQDAITQEARYSLSEEKLLRSAVEFHDVVLYVTADTSSGVETPVRVLDCDTITQVKEKCLDAIFRTTPYSHRPSANDLDIEWRTGSSGRLVLQDMDSTTKGEPGGWKRLNTLAHYKVPNQSSLALLPRQASMYNLSLMSERSEKSSTFSLKNSPTLNRAFIPNSKDPESGHKLYHLVKPQDHGGGPDPPADKMMSEIYLTRLLTMKGTLQKFMEDLLEALFSTAHRGSTLPLCIKWMFDFMDEQALLHGITDPEVVHTWKSNALPLRFWVNLIKNPQFVFDIPRPVKIEGCLSVTAQTLMDACSTQDHQLTKDSPSSKLLFAKDIVVYKDWVDRYYQEIRHIQPVSDQDMNAFLAEESRSHNQQFYVYSALNELYKYLEQYKDQLVQALEDDEFSRRNRLPMKFAQMLATMDGDAYGTT